MQVTFYCDNNASVMNLYFIMQVIGVLIVERTINDYAISPQSDISTNSFEEETTCWLVFVDVRTFSSYT